MTRLEYPEALAVMRAGFTLVRGQLEDEHAIGTLNALENLAETSLLASQTAFGFIVDVQDEVQRFVIEAIDNAPEPQSRKALRVIEGGAA